MEDLSDLVQGCTDPQAQVGDIDAFKLDFHPYKSRLSVQYYMLIVAMTISIFFIGLGILIHYKEKEFR